MKKVICILLCVALCLSLCGVLAACGEKKSGDTLVMATNAAFPPYEYKDGDDFAGIDVEIAQAIAKKLGKTLVIEDVAFGAIVDGVQTGKYDIGMAGMTVTEERLESVNFTTTYAHGVQVVIVPEDSEWTSFEDFYTGFGDDDKPTGVKDGIKIGVQQDTTGDILSSSSLDEWGFGEDNVIRYNTGADAVSALKSGKVTAVIIDNEPAKNYVASNEGLKILDGAYVEEDYAIAIAKDKPELLDAINTALAELTVDGTIPGIIDKFIPAE